MKLTHIFLYFITVIANMTHAQSLNTSLDSVLNKLHKETGTSFSLSIIENRKWLYQNSVGKHKSEGKISSDSKSNYRMASVSKQFTAAAIYLLIDQKKIKLDQTLSSIFPEFGETGNTITIHHLLTHTSGMTDYEELMNEEIKEQLSDQDVMNLVVKSEKTYFEPGTRFKYSNSAYCVLALMVEKISGTTLQQFCKKHIFDPLGMKNTVWYGIKIKNRVYGYAKDKNQKIVFNDQSLTSATLGDGGLYTSLEDYSKWFLNRKELIGLDFNDMIKSSSAFIKNNFAYSFGWFYEHDGNNNPRVILHSGATCGFSNITIEIPHKNMMISYFTNLANNHHTFTEIENILKINGFLEPAFSYRRMHDETH
jgi:CubicO group peptidase (beta-lactamase class C family)